MSTALEWFKSSYSSEQGGACLEVAYAWRKSTYSGSEGGACVEIATCPTAVHVRDSKIPDGPTLTLTSTTWSHFARYAASSHGS
ncbi:DUF397 domain-containing protein [Streptomyces albidochromogenes]|uniref:DUF397 domain-containing protein n=1 Tax=Streptomyces albidochromogenes TaxID=329524 RepID=UPI00110FD1B2|nr:DUF397 domain-containing protein [Streptomyces albidochromogenes]